MVSFESLRSPLAFLQQMVGDLPEKSLLEDYQTWWETEGEAISASVDAAGTPWLRMYDRFGTRCDSIELLPGYWKMLRRGYRDGAVWRGWTDDGAVRRNSLRVPYLLGYVTSFYDSGLYCPYTVSLSTAVQLDKYGDAATRQRFLPWLLRRDDEVWQGATWMTEAKGGSDLGAAVNTVARRDGVLWRLTGEKYFASNVGAELAVVAARPEGAPHTVRGLALFLVPRIRSDGSLNYVIRRLKNKIATRSVPTGEVELRDSEAYLLGRAEWGVYLVLEVLNISRVANSIASVALAQRALADAVSFAAQRHAFGKPVIEHPLLRRQCEERLASMTAAFALAWDSVRLLDEVWHEQPPYSERYHYFRLVTHLAKYWTAEFAVQTAKWAMEVYAGIGTLAEYRIERWLREAMILAIWEGTPHRQILDGLEVMERKAAHRMLFDALGRHADERELNEMIARVERHLLLPPDEKEARAEGLFRDLAAFTAQSLAAKLRLSLTPAI